MGDAPNKQGDLVQGTLDMLVLKSLARGSMHGYAVAEWIAQTSHEILRVEEGALYPALHRLEDRGWVSSYWGASENNRKARFYKLTAAGRKQLTAQTDRWQAMVEAIGRVLSHASRVPE